jgi:hypothetical protein
MNETWITIGWAKKSDDGDHVWCDQNEATFVIGESADGRSNWIAPIGDVYSTAKRSTWVRDRPDYLSARSKIDADKNIGRRVRVLGGNLEHRRTRLQGGEVLIAIRGSVGEPCVVPANMKGCNISREVAMIPIREGISPTFVMYYLATSEAKEFILGNLIHPLIF